MHWQTNRSLYFSHHACDRLRSILNDGLFMSSHGSSRTRGHRHDSLPSFISDPTVVRVHGMLSLRACVCGSRGFVGGTSGLNATERAWKWRNKGLLIYLFTCTNRNLINLSVSYSVLRVWRKVWRLSRGFTCSTTRTRRTSDTASLHVHKDPAYFSPVINHLETLITAYIKHGMKFEFYSLHFMHFSYCDILFVGFHRHVLM